ncbi:MAG: ABC transporter substrate-binding protein [Deltaproteobacteria bacterium]|nr:ABC transporter substrate-binding protein [Deltaproteobacteria bacterium]
MKFLMILLLVVSCSCSKGTGKKEEVKQQEAAIPIPPDQIVPPLESIKALDRKIESYKTGANLTPADLEANRKLKQEIIRGTFDINELCKRAMDLHWVPMSEKERKNFVELMTNLLERKAIFSKEQVRGEGKAYRVDYLNQTFLDPEKKTARVRTKVTVPSQKIDLNIHYEMKLTPYGWQIYDVIVDDASLVENYKFQFDTIIKKHGRTELEGRMKKKLAEME